MDACTRGTQGIGVVQVVGQCNVHGIDFAAGQQCIVLVVASDAFDPWSLAIFFSWTGSSEIRATSSEFFLAWANAGRTAPWAI